MQQVKYRACACLIALAGAMVSGAVVRADNQGNGDGNGNGNPHPTKIFVIAMENHNWTQPVPTASPEQIFQNPAAPFVNSLVNGTSGISGEVAYATNYVNSNIGVHPSEPNYVWAEAGQAFKSIGTDADPYHADCSEDTVVDSHQHLTAFLNKAGRSWRSYQEDVNVDLTTNTALPASAWTAPIFSQSGAFAVGVNAYNYSHQYNYAAKHNPMIFFSDTSGGCPAAPSTHYPPLQQLAIDLQSGDVADYTWITPDQFNDQHSKLTANYGAFTGDQSAVAQGDNFLARVVPLIMASQAYKDGAAIMLWWDESEGGDTPQWTLPFIVISKNAHANVGSLPYASHIEYSHSSFLRTMQEIFHVDPTDGFPWLGAAASATDLSALFRHGALQSH